LPAPVFQEALQLGLSFKHAHAAVEDAHAALARSEARMRTILDTATDAIVTADESGRIVLFNRAAEAMFGRTEEDVLGQSLESLVPLPVRGVHEKLRQQVADGGSRRMAGGRLVEGLRADGRTFHAQASISVADAGDGRLYTAILRPVSQQQQAAA
jgi:two-component system, LuxR family, sensor kinase FixL